MDTQFYLLVYYLHLIVGVYDKGAVEVTNCFTVPHNESEDEVNTKLTLYSTCFNSDLLRTEVKLQGLKLRFKFGFPFGKRASEFRFPQLFLSFLPEGPRLRFSI